MTGPIHPSLVIPINLPRVWPELLIYTVIGIVYLHSGSTYPVYLLILQSDLVLVQGEFKF